MISNSSPEAVMLFDGNNARRGRRCSHHFLLMTSRSPHRAFHHHQEIGVHTGAWHLLA